MVASLRFKGSRFKSSRFKSPKFEVRSNDVTQSRIGEAQPAVLSAHKIEARAPPMTFPSSYCFSINAVVISLDSKHDELERFAVA